MNHLLAQWRQAARTYYHASPTSLPVGTVLTPGGGRRNFGGRADSGAVYMTTDEGYAEQWGNAMAQDEYVPRVYIYEVEPRGEVTEGKGYITDLATGIGDWVEQVEAEAAVIKRLVYSYDTETGEAKYAKTAAVWTFHVEWSRDKDTLKEGELVSGISRIKIEHPAEDPTGARLLAEQMVRGEPTRCTLVDYVE